MRKVIVTVTGTQTDAQGEENRIELITAGSCYEKNGVHFVTYQESEVSGMEGTTTLLKLFPDHLALVRMGKVEQKQEFYPGVRSYSTYVTPFGNLKMSMLTTNLEISATGGIGSVAVAYELEINGEWQSSNTLSVKIREESINEH